MTPLPSVGLPEHGKDLRNGPHPAQEAIDWRRGNLRASDLGSGCSGASILVHYMESLGRDITSVCGMDPIDEICTSTWRA